MEIEDNSPNIERVPTGLWSIDRMLVNDRHEIGLPVNVGYEFFGTTGIGKSTFVYSIAALVAGKKSIALADFEGYDPIFLRNVFDGMGFPGKVKVLHEKSDEDQMDGLIHCLLNDEYAVGILDSVGAISSIGEEAGDIGEANMGQRARLMAKLSRKYLHVSRFADSPSTLFLLNHWYPRIGAKGYTTPGGEVKNYIATVRVLLRRAEIMSDGSYVIECKVYKNRWGYGNGQAYAFILAGQGIHKGLTCLYDGTLLGVVSRKTIIKIGDTSYGYLKDIIQRAHDGDDEFFQPFVDAVSNIKEIKKVAKASDEEFPVVED